MKPDHVKFRREKETNFLIVDEIVFDKLSPYAIKVYGQLRKLTSYTQQDDETEITVKNLAKSAGISERKTYECLNELEHEHHIIQRINIYHFRYGQINSFNVSQTYGHYKPVQTEATPAPETQPVDNSGQNLTTPALSAVPPAQYAVPTAPNAVLYKEQESSQEVFKKKQNKKPVKTSVSVFSCTESVKTHIEMVVGNRNTFVEDEIIDQGIYYSFETNPDKGFDSVNKRINIFLKKVRENKWLIPQGFQGITSQSIRDKEEREQETKRLQYQEEAQAAKNIFTAVNQGQGFKGFSEMFKKLKEDVNGKDADDTGVQKQAV